MSECAYHDYNIRNSRVGVNREVTRNKGQNTGKALLKGRGICCTLPRVKVRSAVQLEKFSSTMVLTDSRIPCIFIVYTFEESDENQNSEMG